jgi:spoIIIJ-associated protein
MSEEIEDLAGQGEQAREFVAGLVDAFGVSGRTTVRTVEDDTIEVAVDGDDLGLLVGPKGATLGAVQELSRTVLSRAVDGRAARLHVDVAGYRERRRTALSRFAEEVAAKVLSSGVTTALEPMGPADRKVVHDTVNAIAGVRTTSEGEEPRRRVVISRDDG